MPQKAGTRFRLSGGNQMTAQEIPTPGRVAAKIDEAVLNAAEWVHGIAGLLLGYNQRLNLPHLHSQL